MLRVVKCSTPFSTWGVCMAIGPYQRVVTRPAMTPPRVVTSTMVTPGLGGASSNSHTPSKAFAA
jgi:hypothetical protein